jgi:hypothetical protein
VSRLPIHLNRAIGYAMNRLSLKPSQRPTDAEIIERMLARGEAQNASQARQALRQAKTNVAATERVAGASGEQSLRAACGYKCDPETRIGVRIVFFYRSSVFPSGRQGSIVVNAPASASVNEVIAAGLEAFQAGPLRGSSSIGFSPTFMQEVDTGNISAVAIGGYDAPNAVEI